MSANRHGSNQNQDKHAVNTDNDLGERSRFASGATQNMLLSNSSPVAMDEKNLRGIEPAATEIMI